MSETHFIKNKKDKHMKKILAGLLVIAAVAIQSCEGPMGAPGLDGRDGQDGHNFLGEVFEVEADFTSSGNFGFLDPFGFEIEESDKVLIYILSGSHQDKDLWRLLPQTVYLPQGIFSYNYDFTNVNYSVFLEGNFDLNTLEPIWTDNQIFRVLIVPADRIDTRMDYSDHDAMLKFLDIDERSIVRKTLNQ